VEARDDLVRHLEAEFDQELLAEAVQRVQRRVAEHTWEAFRLLTTEDLSGSEVAQRLSLKVLTVFKAKSKVQKMLQDEIALLEKGEEGE
jgi:RNA polymerase sigma-70 factor (ECF subfamily)